MFFPGMTLPVNGQSRVPPGFRFHPTDEELVNYYLRKKVALEKFELDVLREIDLNKLEPWDLHETCKIDSTQTEWYFFSHKDKKYPTGTRTNRATGSGFWKATGRDKAVFSNCKRIGMRKTLVFYKGRAPHGQKTDWIMHEYRMEESESAARGNEDGWVICRVFEKLNHHQRGNENNTASIEEVSRHQKSEFCENSEVYSTFTCKEEAEIPECVLPQNNFLQLPLLESPKINSNHLCFMKQILTENDKRTELSQLSFLESAHLAYSKPFISEGFTDYTDGRQLTEWGMIGSSVAKEVKYNSEMNFSGEIHYSLHRQQHIDHPSSYEIDLWNFTK